MRRACIALAAALAAALACGSAGGPPGQAKPSIYKWVDENGIAHYTADREQIPDRLRNRVPRPERATPRAAAEPAPPPTLPGSPATALLPATRSQASAGGSRAAAESHAPAESWAAQDRRPEAAGSAGTSSAVASPTDPADRERALRELDARIAALEADIAEDEEALKARLGEPLEGGSALADDPEARAIAQRLPQRLATLRLLRDERGQLE